MHSGCRLAAIQPSFAAKDNVNPLLCPKCSGSMKIISLIDDSEIIKKILNHLGLWDVKRKPPARANSPPTESFIIYDECSSPCADDYLMDADYPIETYLMLC
jgi:hypothetical protein